MGWLEIGATLAGGLLGSKASKDTQATATKDPWAPAQPYILGSLQRTNDLDRAYQANPFSDLQKQQYSRQFGDSANFRDNVMPGLMDFANSGMSGGYQRGASVIPGGGGYQRPQGQSGPFGLLGGQGGQGNAPMADMFQTPQTPAVDKSGTASPFQSGLLGTQGMPGADGNWGGGAQDGGGSGTGGGGGFGFGSSGFADPNDGGNAMGTSALSQSAKSIAMAAGMMLGIPSSLTEAVASQAMSMFGTVTVDGMAAAMAQMDAQAAENDAQGGPFGGFGSDFGRDGLGGAGASSGLGGGGTNNGGYGTSGGFSRDN